MPSGRRSPSAARSSLKAPTLTRRRTAARLLAGQLSARCGLSPSSVRKKRTVGTPPCLLPPAMAAAVTAISLSGPPSSVRPAAVTVVTLALLPRLTARTRPPPAHWEGLCSRPTPALHSARICLRRCEEPLATISFNSCISGTRADRISRIAGMLSATLALSRWALPRRSALSSPPVRTSRARGERTATCSLRTAARAAATAASCTRTTTRRLSRRCWRLSRRATRRTPTPSSEL